MKTLRNISYIFIITLSIIACKNETQAEVKTIDIETTNKDVSQTLNPNANYAKVEFGIEGMTCAVGCAKTIEKKMAKMEGVKTAKVDFDKRLAMVEYDEAKVTPESLTETVNKVADIYKVKDIKKVEVFSNTKKKTCEANCKMACCKGDEKAHKESCKKNCDKACCTKKGSTK